MKTDADRLRDARKLVERGWCQNASARTKIGLAVDSWDRRAKSFCALGACERAEANFSWITKANDIPTFSMSEWNDAPSRTKEDVLRAFDKAIAFAEVQS